MCSSDLGSALPRDDTSKTFGLRVAYDFRRWLRFGAEFTHTERESTGAGFDYRRNLLLFSVGASL